ncbi:MAG: PcfB family protein [Lachnospiraceae bacterium]|nr:PcfB family protein [Lachnospiraceae bacterium]
MEEEITSRAVNLAVSTTRMTAQSVMNAVRMYIYHSPGRQSRLPPEDCEDEIPRGKMTVRELIGQGQGVSTIPIADTELKGFERVAKKYGVDFAIRKDNSQKPPRYTVFFKARDQDALTAAYKEYAAQMMTKKQRPSVREKLAKFSELVASVPRKIREKTKERGR